MHVNERAWDIYTKLLAAKAQTSTLPTGNELKLLLETAVMYAKAFETHVRG